MASSRRHSRSLRMCFAFVGVILGALHLWKAKAVAASQHAIASSNSNQRSFKPKPPSQAYRHYDHSSPAESQTYQEISQRRSLLLNLGIAIATFGTFLAAVDTYLATKRQAEIAERSYSALTRPWVFASGSVQLENLIVFNHIEPVMTIHIGVSTLGQTPAQRVSASGIIIPNNGDPDLLKRQKEACVRSEAAYHRPIAGNEIARQQTLFPGQLNQNVTAFVGNEAGDFAKSAKRGEHIFTPAIVGCIDYIDNAEVVRQTGFIYNLYKRSSNASGVSALDFSEDNFAPGNLILTSNELGNGAAD